MGYDSNCNQSSCANSTQCLKTESNCLVYSSISTAAIWGIAVAGVLFLFFICLVACLCRRSQEPYEVHSTPPQIIYIYPSRSHLQESPFNPPYHNTIFHHGAYNSQPYHYGQPRMQDIAALHQNNGPVGNPERMYPHHSHYPYGKEQLNRRKMEDRVHHELS